ncbi:MAG TPA: F0F1 ATP synthase subunit B [Candidatus Dormibacteraeota bacterium]|nr:F0F1 ATP synthase subunit B [Candidatus Dormibacteraeota bacterium]
MFVVPNLTLLIQDIAFFVLLFLIARYLYRPIVQVLEARTKRIQEGLRAAEEAQKDREAAEREYQQRLDQARKEGQALLDRIAKQGEDLRKELEAKARGQAEGLIAKARAEIQQEREKAVQDLRGQVADLAVLAAGRIIGESLDAKKHRELIERAIEEAEIRA